MSNCPMVLKDQVIREWKLVFDKMGGTGAPTVEMLVECGWG